MANINNKAFLFMDIKNLHKKLPDKLEAEVCDTIQFFLRSNADQQMRFVIHLSKQLDLDVLRKAARLTIYQEPIFSYTYQENNKGAYWQKQNEIDSSLLVELIEATDNENLEIERFVTSSISPFEFPLVRIKIIRNGQKDILCINMNHTPIDGAGLKEFVKILSANYNILLANPDYICQTNIKGDRSIKQVMNSFTFLQKIRFAKQGFKKPKKNPSWSFNWEKTDSENRNQFAKTKISANTFDRMKAFSKRHNSTINDILISAFIRSFVRTKENNNKVSKPLIIPVDLRKYIKSGHNTALCSLTSSMIINVGHDIGSSFADTLDKVINETSFKKKNHAEMNMLSPLLISSKLMKYDKLKGQMMQRKMPPIPLFTNIGKIEPNDINFNNISVDYAYMTGVVSYGDYFAMGCSTFNNEITFSIGFNGNDLQLLKANNFLKDLKTELENIK
jgi:NRPS condensation-like uncharacterized protein